MSQLKLLSIVIFGWGFGSFFYKFANDKINPIIVEVIATFVYLLMIPMWLMLFKPTYEVNGAGFIYSIFGAIAMCVGTVAFFFAIKNGNVGEVTVLSSLYPIITLGLSCLFLGEQLSIKNCIGVVLAFISIYLIGIK